MSQFDEDAHRKAQQDADRDKPLPEDTPKEAALKYALGAFLAVLSLELLLPLIGLFGWQGSLP